MIYADNAATTKMSREAIDAMLPYFDKEYGNPSSLHSQGQKAGSALSSSRKVIADIFNCSPDEIRFTSGGSESDTQAIISAAMYGSGHSKKHIVSTAIEHHAVLNTLKALERYGFKITLLSPESNGIIDADKLSQAIRPDTALVSVMYANNEIGTIQPIAEIGRLCRKRGIIFHTDAVQAAGHIDIDVERDYIDMLSVSAHKFHGPKGIGALYVRNGIPLTPIIKGGGQEYGTRAGTENLPGIVGMAAALRSAVSHINDPQLTSIRNRLIDSLISIPGAVLNGDHSKRLPGNINISFDGIEGSSLALLLNEKGICVSAGSACNSSSDSPSHVLIALGRSPEAARSAIRISLSHENTAEEADKIAFETAKIVRFLRSLAQ